jgi:hypothetical protein
VAASKSYLFVFIGFFSFLLGLILLLNLMLGERGLGSVEAVRQASAWQQATQGVTFAPPLSQTRAFKAHRLADRITDVNTVVLGASSLMGITQAMFPVPMRIYNFSLTANPTSAITAEAEYIERRHARRVRTLVIGLDWAISMIYRRESVADMDLTPAATLAGYGASSIPLYRKLTDALALPKVSNLLKVLRAVAAAEHPLASFRHTFFDIAGAEYRCPDGQLARDFDVQNRGICLGFRHDGSWTFAGDNHLSRARADVLARAAAVPSSKFFKYLCETQGAPNPEYLLRLGSLARRLIDSGGHAVFILPPLIPGMEHEMSKVSAAHRCLVRTKTVLNAWAREYGVTVIDAAASENFGCKTEEFLDENHAWPECHKRVMDRYWGDRARGAVSPGLYRPSP